MHRTRRLRFGSNSIIGAAGSVHFTVREKPRYLEGLSGITNLGDVFRYEPSEPNRISVRVHNSHFDTYFILLVNPDLPQHQGFDQISANVGFID